MVSDISENGFEVSVVLHHLAEVNGYEIGEARLYNKTYQLDEERLFRYLSATQEEKLKPLNLDKPQNREKFLKRLKAQIEKDGTLSLLRKGFDYYPAGKIYLYSALPSEGNKTAEANFQKNIFCVTRQLRFSNDTEESIDLVIFLNGLPIISIELKNSFTHQTFQNAIRQYKDRNHKEPYFHPKRVLVHFAVDDSEVHMATKIEGDRTTFFPFNKGNRDGAGNPPNPNGLKTSYLWEDTLQKETLAGILENYLHWNTKHECYLFPRYHQIEGVKALLAHAKENGVGQRYLIQHSAGSGKSNSIAWLALQLVSLQKDGKDLFDSVLIVTDRINLDKNITGVVNNMADIKSVIAHADKSENLKEHLKNGKKIIITTVFKFPHIVDSIKDNHANKTFAIIIDEAHSSQSGKSAASLSLTLSKTGNDDEVDVEDIINHLADKKRMLPNASYFAFTATPKNKTLETFGVPYEEDGDIKHRPFHLYTMKQAIQEGFILDVLQNYTPVKSYYNIIKSTADDPRYDRKKALKKIKAYVEKEDYPIQTKADIIIDHLIHSVIKSGKIRGNAKAMLVCRDILSAIDYYHAVNRSLAERNNPCKTIIAFSGDKEVDGIKVNEAYFNGFPSSKIEEVFKKDSEYRLLIVADKFQTGYDEPLLHTMYVDKHLSDVKAVQTLSRLNRAAPGKHDTFVLDFFNDPEEIQKSFSRYYKATLLSSETDPNKLYDLLSDIEGTNIYSKEQRDSVVSAYLKGEGRTQLDPALDAIADIYKHQLDLETQIKVKSTIKNYLRTYGFLSAILPIGNPEWERESIFLELLLPKLPAPVGDDLAKGILETVDLDSYRAEILETRKLILDDEDAEIQPVPTSGAMYIHEPEMEYLSVIVSDFNDLFGSKDISDENQKILREIPRLLREDSLYMNTHDRENAKIRCKQFIDDYIAGLLDEGNFNLYAMYADDEDFKKRFVDLVFRETFKSKPGA